MEDDIPTSIGPAQPLESALQQHHDLNAEYHLNYPMEHTTAQSSSTEPHLNVNFDSFLQSQEGPHAPATLSQQRREERWIPSTGEGGDGSMGASAQQNPGSDTY